MDEIGHRVSNFPATPSEPMSATNSPSLFIGSWFSRDLSSCLTNELRFRSGRVRHDKVSPLDCDSTRRCRNGNINVGSF